MHPAVRFAYEAAQSETDECVLWPGRTFSSGYPTTDRRRHDERPVAIVCRLAFGPVEGPFRVHRKCGEPRCLNPRHLDRRPYRVRPGHCRKLTDAQVIRARKRYARGGISQPALAAIYGVSRTAMADILCGRSYARLPYAVPKIPGRTKLLPVR